jgi:hypothetical protein
MPTATKFMNSKKRAITLSDRGAFFVKSGDKKYYSPKAVFKKTPSGSAKKITVSMSDSVPLRIRKFAPSGKKRGRPAGPTEGKLLRQMDAASRKMPRPKILTPGGTRFTSKKKMMAALAARPAVGKKTYFA